LPDRRVLVAMIWGCLLKGFLVPHRGLGHDAWGYAWHEHLLVMEACSYMGANWIRRVGLGCARFAGVFVRSAMGG